MKDVEINIGFFGSPPSDGFRFYPLKDNDRYRRFDSSSKQNQSVFYYEIGHDGTCYISSVEYAVISGQRGFRTFGLSVEIINAEIQERYHVKVFNFIRLYIDNEILPEGKLLQYKNSNLRYIVNSFNEVSRELDYWIEDLESGFRNAFNNCMIPISEERLGQNYKVDDLETNIHKNSEKIEVSKKFSNNNEVTGNQPSLSMRKDLETLDEVTKKEKRSNYSKDSTKQIPYMDNNRRSYRNKKSFVKSIKAFLGCTKLNLKTHALKIILLLTCVNLLFSLWNWNKVQSLSHEFHNQVNVSKEQMIEANTIHKRPQIKQFGNKNDVVNCDLRIYRVQEGDGMNRILKKIKSECGVELSVQKLVELNDIELDTIRKWYKISSNDLLKF